MAGIKKKTQKKLVSLFFCPYFSVFIGLLVKSLLGYEKADEKVKCTPL